MARRSDHTKTQLKELALREGLDFIDKNGFHNFSARAVAKRMGYTVGTLYNVFGSLDEFILQLNAKTLDEWYAELVICLQREPKNPLAALAQTYLHPSRSYYPRFKALFEYNPKDRQIPDWYQEKLFRFFSLVEVELEKSMPKEKAQHAAKILWAGVHGICALSLSGKLDVVRAEAPETMIQDFLNLVMGDRAS